jgi:lysophospholipase L1-like esterase
MRHLLLTVRFFLGLVIFVLVLELCARVDDALSYNAPFWAPYNTEILYTRDQIGQRGRPGARYEKWQLNSLGYRGPELRPGTIRIACFGASETFGLYEAEGQEYPRQLERELNSRVGRDVFQVVNVAYAGETVPTATLRVPEIVAQIHASYAIIYPSLAAYIWLPSVREEPVRSSAPTTDASYTQVRFEWRIAKRLRNLLKQALPSIVQTKLRQREIKEAATQYPVMDRVPEENVLRFRGDLSRLVAALRAREVEPLLVTHATAFGKQLSESDRELLVSWRKFYPMLREDGFLDMEQRMNGEIRQVANQEQIMLVDAADEIPPGRKYFVDFSHFTTAGAEVMASLLADGLQPLIDARLPHGTPVEPSSPAELKKRN